MMRKFGFRVVLSGLSQASEGLAHSLYDAGCTDTSVSSHNGAVAVRFRRESEALDLAIVDACMQIRSAGYEVERIEMDWRQVEAIAEDCATTSPDNYWR